MEFEGIEIEWLGHAAFLISNDKVSLMIDPYQIPGTERVDLIIATHEHYDHCSPEDVERLLKKNPSATIITTESCAKKIDCNKIKTLKAGKTASVKGVKIHAVEAYNLDKEFHPRGLGIGVVIEIDGKRIYHAGDTDHIPEMAELGKIDVALLPVSGTYVMTAEEAVKAANKIKPRLAIPMHYGSIVGDKEDAERFDELYRGKSEILG